MNGTYTYLGHSQDSGWGAPPALKCNIWRKNFKFEFPIIIDFDLFNDDRNTILKIIIIIMIIIKYIWRWRYGSNIIIIIIIIKYKSYVLLVQTPSRVHYVCSLSLATYGGEVEICPQTVTAVSLS